jgi:hypothetical protein
MPLDPQDDLTPDLAEALDDAREEISPGERICLLRHTGELERGYEPIDEIGANGELAGGWLTSLRRAPGPMSLRLAQMDPVTAEQLAEQLAAWARFDDERAVWEVFAVLDNPRVPSSPALRDWIFRGTLTSEPFAVLELWGSPFESPMEVPA